MPISFIARRTWKSFLADNLLGRSAELGFYFFFALFPILFSASSILGLIARSASHIYERLLGYLSLVMPMEALGSVMKIFHETTEASSSGKVTFGLIATIWSASVGISAIQDTLNAVYKVQETRSYIKARLGAIGITIILTILGSLCLASLLGADFFAALANHRIQNHLFALGAVIAVRLLGWLAGSYFPELFVRRDLLLGSGRKNTSLALAYV